MTPPRCRGTGRRWTRGVAGLRCVDELVERDAVVPRERDEQFQRRTPLARLDPREGTERDAGRPRHRLERRPGLGPDCAQPWPDAVDDRRHVVLHPAMFAPLAKLIVQARARVEYRVSPPRPPAGADSTRRTS